MGIAKAKFLAGLTAGTLSLLTTGSVVASPAAIEPATPAAVQPIAPHMWTAEAIAGLLQEIADSAGEGLDPAAYDAEGLAQALALQGLGPESDAAATRIALEIAEDYALGHSAARDRVDWHIEAATSRERLNEGLQAAIRAGSVRDWLHGLLPSDARYAALRTALASTPAEDAAMRGRLRANMERWRWMPRALGSDHIWVNVPSYRLEVVDDGRPVSTYTVVVGKPATPTPQMMAQARSIVVNPWWNVPPSIARTMRGGKGFVTKAGGGYAQPPGPRNALGKVKIDMPNPHAIYLHDTPSKALFAESSRAYSHGCIRVKDIDRLAAELATLDQGDAPAVAKALAGGATRTVALGSNRPVYLVYFTAEVGRDGKVIALDDPYNRDGRLVAGLDGSSRMADASQNKRGRG